MSRRDKIGGLVAFGLCMASHLQIALNATYKKDYMQPELVKMADISRRVDLVL
jgi:hypothetical protein